MEKKMRWRNLQILHQLFLGKREYKQSKQKRSILKNLHRTAGQPREWNFRTGAGSLFLRLMRNTKKREMNLARRILPHRGFSLQRSFLLPFRKSSPK